MVDLIIFGGMWAERFGQMQAYFCFSWLSSVRYLPRVFTGIMLPLFTGQMQLFLPYYAL